MAEAETTRDHETIPRWVEEPSRRPARIKEAQSRREEEGVILCIDLAEPGESLEKASGDQFLGGLDDRELSSFARTTSCITRHVIPANSPIAARLTPAPQQSEKIT